MNPYISYKVEKESMAETKDYIEKLVQKILKKEYTEMAADQQQCKQCNMSYFCEAYRKKCQ